MFYYLKWAYLVTILGFVLSFFVGLGFSGHISDAIEFLFICSVLAVLEISLSFDNAIVNANKLKTMSQLWRRRFLTWGILIAVFGMRIIFPLLVVMISAGIGPINAIHLTLYDPQRYSEIINDAHISISAFGASFLMLVALSYFIDSSKDIDWISLPERLLRRCDAVRGINVTIVLTIVVVFSQMLPPNIRGTFVYAGVIGILTFLVVQILGELLDKDAAKDTAARGGLGAFLYLEVLDSSFSFDGVIGAFALTQNLVLIAIGLGIGAMYVRSMTIMLLEKGVLANYCYLENGAFWSILVLSCVMAAQSLVHIPEVVTGLFSISFIALAFWSSVRATAKEAA